MTTLELKTWPAVFRNTDKEQAYRKASFKDEIGGLTVILILATILNLVFIRADYSLLQSSSTFYALLTIRFIYALFSITLLIMLHRFRKPSLLERPLHIWIGLTLATNALIGCTRPPDYSLNAVIDLFMLFICYSILPLHLNFKWIVGIIYSIVNFFIFLQIRSEFTILELNALTVSYLAVNATGLYIAWRTDLLQRKQYKFLIQEKQLKNKLVARAANLEAINAELDRFSHTVAHDLKNPLSSMMLTSEALTTGLINATFDRQVLSKYADNLQQSTQHMTNIVNSIMLLARVRKKEDVDISPLNMAKIIEDVMERLSAQTTLAGATISKPEQWHPALGYSPWVEEMWSNYLSNAIKYGGQPPQIEIGCTAIKNDTVKFWIRDNGKGVDAAKKSSLFMEFSKLSSDKFEGHGLGLSIVKRIAEKLDGQVGYEGNQGQGATFFFTLPSTTKHTRNDTT